MFWQILGIFFFLVISFLFFFFFCFFFGFLFCFFLAKNKNIFPVDSTSNSLPRFSVPENKIDELINLFIFLDDEIQKNQILISEINYDFGSGWEITLNNKQKIIFARDMSSQSMERFQILMRYLYANSLNPSIIDMRNKSGAALKYGN